MKIKKEWKYRSNNQVYYCPDHPEYKTKFYYNKIPCSICGKALQVYKREKNC